MSRPIYEPSLQRTDARLGYSTAQLARRPAQRPPNALFHIKVFGDLQLVTAGDGKFIFEIPREMDGMILVEIETYVTTVSSSGDPTVQLHNNTAAVDMLSTPCSIDAGELNSKDATTQPVIDVANADVSWGDHLRIDVDTAGTGAKGLGVILTFGNA